MKSLLLSFLIFTMVMSGSAQIVSAGSGSWNNAATWVGNVVPGDGDSVSIADGHTIRVTDNRIIGGSNHTVAVRLNNSGSLVIDSACTLRVRGNVTYHAGSANTSDVITVNAGATWMWDASKSASPKYTHYKFYPDGTFGYRAVVANGTFLTPAYIKSDTTGGNGCFVMNGQAYGNPFHLSYANISHIGTDSLYSFQFWYYSPGKGIHPVVYDVRHSTFNSCGEIYQTYSSDSNGTFRHDYNTHLNSLGADVMSIDYVGQTAGTGIREIIGNVMDSTPFYFYSALGGFTISHNYFGGDIIAGLNDHWASYDNNFSRITIPAGAEFVPSGNSSNSYLMIDMDQGNPHVVFPTQWPSSHTGLVFSQSGSSHGDSGEMFLGSYLVTPTEYDVKNCIFLADMYGYSSGEMTSMGGPPDPLPAFEHNTWFGGHANNFPGFGAFDYSETGNVYPGQIHSLRSNIFWNPQLAATPAHFLKMYEIDNEQGTANDGGYDPGGGPTLDPVGSTLDPTSGIYTPDVSKADYNAGWGFSDSSNAPNHAAYHNQGNGYVGNWSSTPGKHDVNADPKFYDWQRDVVLFDNAYLLNTAPAWSSSAIYAVGDMVSAASPVAFWGKTVNFRYTNGAGCSSSNPRPMTGSEPTGDTVSWRHCWEFASLYRLREGVMNQKMYTDTAIGASNDDILLTLIKWIRRGYTPTNNAYRGTAHDGTDIGAVPMRVSTTSVLNQQTVVGDLSVFPNPGNGTFKLQFLTKDIALPYTLEVYNGVGQKVFSKIYASDETIVKVENAKPGIYFVRVTTMDGRLCVTKLVVE